MNDYTGFAGKPGYQGKCYDKYIGYSTLKEWLNYRVNHILGKMYKNKLKISKKLDILSIEKLKSLLYVDNIPQEIKDEIKNGLQEYDEQGVITYPTEARIHGLIYANYDLIKNILGL